MQDDQPPAQILNLHLDENNRLHLICISKYCGLDGVLLGKDGHLTVAGQLAQQKNIQFDCSDAFLYYSPDCSRGGRLVYLFKEFSIEANKYPEQDPLKKEESKSESREDRVS